jgi:hypothetical protein
VEHFSSLQWVDFLHTTESPSQRSNMQEHLDQGCKVCTAQASVWTCLMRFAQQESSYEPPASAVRIAKSYFHAFSQAFKNSADVRILRHTYDSLNVGALIGVRGSPGAPRQLLYNSSSVFVDLRMEQKKDSRWMALTGQVVDAQLEDGIPHQCTISLLGRRDPAIHATTSDCGEFAFQFKPNGAMALLLSPKDVALLLLLPPSEGE